MKMAKASEADIQMAMDLANALESVERDRCFPMAMRPDPDDLARFDVDDGEHCRELVEYLLKLVRSASLMRVMWGMAVLLDPRNKIVDPNADTLERYPSEALKPNAQETGAPKGPVAPLSERLLFDSVPERWKNCASGVGAVQSYIAELEGRLVKLGVDLDNPPALLQPSGEA